jgi:hypothetical protein
MWQNVQGMPCSRARGYLPGKSVELNGFAGTKVLLGGHSHQHASGGQHQVGHQADRTGWWEAPGPHGGKMAGHHW